MKALKSKYRQYATTNGSKEAQDKKLSKSHLIDIFDDVFISEVVGYDKPSLEYFDYIFSKIGHYQKEEMILIGDSLTSDMLGAINSNITSCWYNPKHLENKLGLKVDYEIDDLNEIIDILEEMKI